MDFNAGELGIILSRFLVLSVIFEVALTPVFNWRIFLRYLEGKGWKTPITVGLAFAVFWGFKLEIIADVLNAMKGIGAGSAGTDLQQPSPGGQILTALLIAGGSDGVFRIFSKLGIRDPVARKEKVEAVRAGT